MPELEELQRQIEELRVLVDDALDKFPIRSTTTSGASRERHIHDLRNHVGAAKLIRKTADQTVNNSTTLVDDTHLLFAIGSSETWFYQALVVFNTGATPAIKFGMTVPSGATLVRTVGRNIAAASNALLQLGVIAVAGTGSDIATFLVGTVVNGTTAGDVQVQWAQNVADASDTKVLTNSWIMGWQV